MSFALDREGPADGSCWLASAIAVSTLASKTRAMPVVDARKQWLCCKIEANGQQSQTAGYLQVALAAPQP